MIQMFEFVIPHGSEGRADKVLANASRNQSHANKTSD